MNSQSFTPNQNVGLRTGFDSTTRLVARYEDARSRSRTLGLWIFIASEAFLFSALISSRYYLVGLNRPEHLNQPLGLTITSILLLSSLTAYRAEAFAKAQDDRGLLRNVLATIGLGLLFMVGVVLEWREALEFFPPSTTYGSVFLATVGLHAFHVATGLVALGVVGWLVSRGRILKEDPWAVEAVVKYWHFVDVAWVFIFPTLYLVK